MVDLTQYGVQMWEKDKIQAFRETLLAWYDDNKRDLPWRRTKDPYAIWVSEIMLQQTRVDTVIPYYESFLHRLPTIADLASADEEILLKVWEGLGYYSRVRNMQTAAQQMMTQFEGKFPDTYEDILSLKGIGPYTAGAVASIAFNLKEPAVDGNVMRVLSRLFEVDYDIGIASNRKIFQSIMEILIDPSRPGDFNQALMDLGSDIESPHQPRPEESPVKEFSAAYLHGTMDKYPIKAPKKKPSLCFYKGFIIRNEKNEFLLEKNEEKGLLSGFWTFPLIEEKTSHPLALVDLAEQSPPYLANRSFEASYQLFPDWQATKYQPVHHLFSHRKWQIELIEGVCETNSFSLPTNMKWVAVENFPHFPFAKPQQKMWESYKKAKA